MVGVHKSLEKAVMSKVHRKGRVQLVKLKGLMGRNLIFGSLYAPTESEEGDDTKRGVFWKEDWKELGVKSTRGWCNKVKDKGWLASKLGKSKKKGKGKKKD